MYYNDNYENFDDNSSNNEKESIDDEIYRLEDIQLKIEEDIRYLWNHVIIAYKQNINNCQILDKINEYDFAVFCDFMLSKNKVYRKTVNKIKYLKSKLNKKI
jgi:hypothetical protein